ncbi:MAG: glycoside hydrolase domain-containing protein [Lachnospira eligens]
MSGTFKRKGWFEITYISMDERGLDQLEPAVDMTESITDEEGNHFKISSALNYAAPQYYDFTDRIDDISINQGNASDRKQMQALSQHRRELD